MKSIRRGRERLRDRELPGPSENQANDIAVNDKSMQWGKFWTNNFHQKRIAHNGFPSSLLIAAIAVAPTGKASFVYSYVQTKLKGQYKEK